MAITGESRGMRRGEAEEEEEDSATDIEAMVWKEDDGFEVMVAAAWDPGRETEGARRTAVVYAIRWPRHCRAGRRST